MAKSSKKVVIKKSEPKGKVTKIIHESTKEIKVEQSLINNFIALQKVMTSLSAKFDNLSDQISKLLQLFEISAKSLAKKEFESVKEESISSTNAGDMKKIIEKLDNLSKQAGLIGKGLALIHEVSAEKTMPPSFTNKIMTREETPMGREITPSILSSQKPFQRFQQASQQTLQKNPQQNQSTKFDKNNQNQQKQEK